MTSSYLSNRTQPTKINESFSERSQIVHGVSQGSSLSLLLFNIDLIDLFYECEENNIASYVDGTSPYCSVADTHTVISEFQIFFKQVFSLVRIKSSKSQSRKMSFTFKFNNSY